jgi:putative DNA methylase
VPLRPAEKALRQTLVAKLGSKAEIARELAYRLYNLCERKKRAAEALSYNSPGPKLPEIMRLASGSESRSLLNMSCFRKREG